MKKATGKGFFDHKIPALQNFLSCGAIFPVHLIPVYQSNLYLTIIQFPVHYVLFYIFLQLTHIQHVLHSTSREADFRVFMQKRPFKTASSQKNLSCR